MAVVLVNSLTATCVKYIHPSAAVLAAKKKLSSQKLTQEGREHAGPFVTCKYRF
jgi:hypothetical protein